MIIITIIIIIIIIITIIIIIIINTKEKKIFSQIYVQEKRIYMKVTSCILVLKSAKKVVRKKSGSAFHCLAEK